MIDSTELSLILASLLPDERLAYVDSDGDLNFMSIEEAVDSVIECMAGSSVRSQSHSHTFAENSRAFELRLSLEGVAESIAVAIKPEINSTPSTQYRVPVPSETQTRDTQTEESSGRDKSKPVTEGGQDFAVSLLGGTKSQSEELQTTLPKNHLQDGPNGIENEDYPLFSLVSQYLFPFLQNLKTNQQKQPRNPPSESSNRSKHVFRPSRLLFTSHHLLSPTKRKDLASLASAASLFGFAKTGHPGIIYAEGDYADLEEFAREVKSWNWLALRLRVLEEIKVGTGELESERRPEAAKTRSIWEELEKVGEAVEWMRRHRGVEGAALLTDLGIGAAGGGTGEVKKKG